MTLRKWLSRLLQAHNPVEELRTRLESFRALVEGNSRILGLIADAGENLGGEYIFDNRYVHTFTDQVRAEVHSVVFHLEVVTGRPYPDLLAAVRDIDSAVKAALAARAYTPKADLVIPLDAIGIDLADVVGHKMARLGEIKTHLGCTVPDGFAITAHASEVLLETCGIRELVQTISDTSHSAESKHWSSPEWASEVRTRLANTRLSKKTVRAIRRATRRLVKSCPSPQLAVRSSAIGEDGEVTFAGQLKSVLNVTPDAVLSAYLDVVASLFSGTAIEYRRAHGLHPADGLIAVGCLCMVEARASGVLYTLDPASPERDIMTVAATPGLGKAVVEGTAPVDTFEISREAPCKVVKRTLVGTPGGAATSVCGAADASHHTAGATVSDSELQALASEALRIERYMKCAQDIEWAFDCQGRLFILQTRPLFVSPPQELPPTDLRGLEEEYTVLLRDTGTVACRGIGCGPVHRLDDDEDPDSLPSGQILVARTSTPRLAAAVARSNAVITDMGSAAGHLATVAREFRVPMIVDTRVATTVLADAGEVTVDAEENVVYEGRVAPLLHHQLLRRSSFEDTPEFRLLRRTLHRIAPLHLQDPQSADFAAANCTTYHDVIRFAHEEAIQSLAEGHRVQVSARNPYVHKLDLEVPLGLTVVDLGGGLPSHVGKASVQLEEIQSEPLNVLLEGLQSKDVWTSEPADMDLHGFMSSATRSMPVGGALGTKPQQNIALISRNYLHLSLRLGYHFNVVDSYMSERIDDNFIYFRFAGGVTEIARRSRRARLLRRILESNDFVVEGKGDLVIGRVRNIDQGGMHERLLMIGRLIGFTRQLDILLRTDDLVERYASRFLSGRNDQLDI